MSQKLCWCVFLQDVASTFDPVQLSVRDPVVQPSRVIGWEDAILSAPDQARRDGDLAEQLLVLRRMLLFDLTVLAVEGGLSGFAAPGGEERVEDRRSVTEIRGVAHVAGDQFLVGVARKLMEHLGVLQYELEQAAFPLAAAHGVEQSEVSEVRPFQQHAPQCDRAADVMSHDAGVRQFPVVEELGEVSGVRGQAEVLALALLGLAEAEQVEYVDPSRAGECRHELAPEEG